MRNARDIDAAAAWIAFGSGAAELSGRLDAIHVDENVDGGIDGERDDVRHFFIRFD
jgi:hypothetical protein